MYPHLWGGGHIVFGADPVSVYVGVGVAISIGVGVVVASHFLVCKISCEPLVGFLPNFHDI